MDYLLLFCLSKESHVNKLEDLLKALLKNGLKISSKKCQLSEPINSICAMKYLFKTGRYVCSP